MQTDGLRNLNYRPGGLLHVSFQTGAVNLTLTRQFADVQCHSLCCVSRLRISAPALTLVAFSAIGSCPKKMGDSF